MESDQKERIGGYDLLAIVVACALQIMGVVLLLSDLHG